jgi:hypothetical protein
LNPIAKVLSYPSNGDDTVLRFLSLLRAKAGSDAIAPDEENASLKKGLEVLLDRYFSPGDYS